MITIFYSSRNNYEMLRDEVLPKLNFEGFKVINIDDNSSEEQKNLGRQICKDSNIPFIENTGRGIQWSINTAVNNVSTPYSVWLTHDVTPITANFFTKLSNFLSDNSSILEHQIGLFGFNLTWKPFTNEYSPNRAGCLGRSPLAKFPNPKANQIKCKSERELNVEPPDCITSLFLRYSFDLLRCSLKLVHITLRTKMCTL